MAFRNDDPDALADANGPGKDGYTGGTPGVDAPTPCRAVDLNMFQEEICNAVETTSVLNKSRNNQLATSILRLSVGMSAGNLQAQTGANSNTTFGGASDQAASVGGSRIMMLVGSSGGIQTSTSPKPGDSALAPSSAAWTSRTAAGSFSSNFYATTWSSPLTLWCLVGQNQEIQTSPDAINFTQQTAAGSSTNHRDVIWDDDNSRFLLLRQDGGIEQSTNGITWTTVAGAGVASAVYTGLAYSSALTTYVRVGYHATSGYIIEYSSDAATWSTGTPAASPGAGSVLDRVVWSDASEAFCVSGLRASGEYTTQQSTDGQTFTDHNVYYGTGTNLTSLVVVRGIFAFTYTTTNEQPIYVSADGATFDLVTTVDSASGNLRLASSGDALFGAVGGTTTLYEGLRL